jgi:aprataxin
MSSQTKKPKPTAVPAVDAPSVLEKAKNVVKAWDPRNGLDVYIESPETNPEQRVIWYDDDFVLINDKYPKARYVLDN